MRERHLLESKHLLEVTCNFSDVSAVVEGNVVVGVVPSPDDCRALVLVEGTRTGPDFHGSEQSLHSDLLRLQGRWKRINMKERATAWRRHLEVTVAIGRKQA